ncbi:MAG: hypothetical protein R2715_15815 [Ilumatobacteraceae bacterium]
MSGEIGSPRNVSDTPKRTAQLGKRPAEGAERIVSVGEQQLGELPAETASTR